MVTPSVQTPYESLSKRAVDILRLLDEGMSDREIAERLVMTINTVKWYNRQIYSILDVSSRTQAIARARELQLLDDEAGTQVAFQSVPLLPKHNLPADVTPFIGRKHAIADITRLLDSTRLLTLVGPPGTGKTRLSLRLGHELIDMFRDGVYFISLAPLSDPAMVTSNIAGCIGVSESPGQPLIETLKQVLRDSHMLLILDNFEHLLLAAPQVSDLLAAAPHLKVLATSREPLHLYGEQEYAVPSLVLPDLAHLDPYALAACESTALFMQQARAVRSDFELTPENALDVAQICLRLEGLPLAIELAAARSKLLTPSALLARLNNRLDTLTGGAHDLPARHKTLRQTIAWSYDLLNDEEKKLFSRMAVFRGGRSLEAITTICGPGLGIDSLDGVESLLNKSLLIQQEVRDAEPRFLMLETIHEYAWEQLQASGEADMLRCRHAEYYVDFAERAEPELRQARFSYWMAQVGIESGNMCAVLEWSLDTDHAHLGLRLIAALRDYWIMSGGFSDGKTWTQRALSKFQSVPPDVRVRVLTAAGLIFFYSPERTLQKQVLEEAVEIGRILADKVNLAWALSFLGNIAIGLPSGFEQALAATEEGLALFRELGHKPGMAQALNIIGELTRTYGDDERARLAYEECLLLVSETGETRRESMVLGNLGFIAIHQNDIERADWLFKQSLIKALELEVDKHLIISSLTPLASVMAARGALEQAVRLIGATESLLEPMGVGLQAGDQPEYDRNLSLIRAQIDAATFEAAWTQGQMMTLEQAVVLALEDSDA
jgi:predicted ATPase/DNA-binding CsgD family transcriptional regulator